MATFWWKTVIVQLLLSTTIITTRSSGFELDGNSKTSNENIILLLDKIFKDIHNQRASEETSDNVVDRLYDFYNKSPLTLLNGKRNVGRNDRIRNDDLRKIMYRNVENINNNNGNVWQKRDKNHYVTTLCRFKICNKKRSLDNNFMRYITNDMDTQQQL